MNSKTENIQKLPQEDLTDKPAGDEISLEETEKIVGGGIEIFLTIDGIKGESGAR